MKGAKIDTTLYTSHSSRGAVNRKLMNKGLSLDALVKIGDWSNSNNIKTYYSQEQEKGVAGAKASGDEEEITITVSKNLFGANV